MGSSTIRGYVNSLPDSTFLVTNDDALGMPQNQKGSHTSEQMDASLAGTTFDYSWY